MKVSKTSKALDIQKGSLTQLDKIRGYLMNEVKRLNKRDKILLNRILKISALCEKRYSKSQIIKIICAKDFLEVGNSLNERQAYNLYNDTIKVFGDINKINKAAERYFSHERYLILSRKAEEIGDYQTAGRMQEQADKLYGLFEEDIRNDIPPSMFFQQVNVIRTSNPEILKKNEAKRLKTIQLNEPAD